MSVMWFDVHCSAHFLAVQALRTIGDLKYYLFISFPAIQESLAP